MKRLITAALIAAAVAGCRPDAPEAAAEPASEEAEVLRVVHRFLEAMEARDVEAYAEVLVPEGMTFSQRIGPDGPGPLRIRSQAEHIAALAESDQLWQERIWDPVVLVHPPIAVVWTPYDFHIDGRLLALRHRHLRALRDRRGMEDDERLVDG
jgi:hypothetical protein